VLSLKSNELRAAGGKALAEGLKGNQVITELNIAGNNLGMGNGRGGADMSGIIALADVIPDMGALSFLDISSNKLWENWTFSSDQWWLNGHHPPGYPNGGCKEKPEETNQGFLAMCDAIKNMGAISSVNLIKNAIPVDQAQELVKIMQSKEKLITLCGLSGKEATLDFSNQGLGPGDAVLIANDISNMRALTKFDISTNSLHAAGAKALAEGLKGNQVITELNIADNSLGYKLGVGSVDMSGIIALADVIPDMGAIS
jgi:hypothetical protein